MTPLAGVIFGSIHGTSDRSRTYNLILRTDLLYPVELPRHTAKFNR